MVSPVPIYFCHWSTRGKLSVAGRVRMSRHWAPGTQKCVLGKRRPQMSEAQQTNRQPSGGVE